MCNLKGFIHLRLYYPNALNQGFDTHYGDLLNDEVHSKPTVPGMGKWQAAYHLYLRERISN